MARSLCPDSSGATSGSKCVQVRRQIDIHVGEDLGVALRPDGAQRPAGPALHVHRPHLAELAGQPGGNRPRGVAAAVVRDRDPGGEREAVTEEADQAPDARREIMLLIAHRNHNVHLQNSHDNENRPSSSAPPEATLCARYEQSRDADRPTLTACRIDIEQDSGSTGPSGRPAGRKRDRLNPWPSLPSMGSQADSVEPGGGPGPCRRPGAIAHYEFPPRRTHRDSPHCSYPDHERTAWTVHGRSGQRQLSGHTNRHVTAPRSPKSAWITSPDRTKTGRVNDPDKITWPAGRHSS